MNAPLRIGLVGAGMVSAFHLPAWRALGAGVTLCGIADPDRVRAQACADQHGIEHVYGSFESLLRHEALDAVDLMTPPALHASQCRAAAEAGVAVLCQKPLAPTWAEARHLLQDVGGRVRWMVHENWRFRPHYRQVSRWVEDGCIGRTRAGRLHVCSSGLLPGANGRMPAIERQPMLATLPRLMIGEVLVHHLDVACWLSGVDTVQNATMVHAVQGIRGESAAMINLIDGHGTTFEVSGDMADASALPTLRDSLWLAGDRGEIRLDAECLVMEAMSGRQEIRVDLNSGYQASYDGAIAHFANCLSTGLPFETLPEWHLHVLALAEQAYASAARAKGVSL